MTEPAALRLFKGHTVHQRSVPFTHRFKYDLALIDIDVDRLSDAETSSRLFSVDGSNLFSFRCRDHGDRSGEGLRAWAETEFQEAGLEIAMISLRLITFPRHAFYKFAPISLWMAYDADSELSGILYEVNNTFGETHIYAAATSNGRSNKHDADKAFHVSPFFDVSGTYQFTLTCAENALKLIVASQNAGQQTHVATIKAKAYPATTAAFLSLAITKPLSSLGVTFAIHWQAFKLWLKGAKYHSKPKQSSVRTTIATPRNAAPHTASARETIL